MGRYVAIVATGSAALQLCSVQVHDTPGKKKQILIIILHPKPRVMKETKYLGESCYADKDCVGDRNAACDLAPAATFNDLHFVCACAQGHNLVDGECIAGEY